MSTNAKRGTTVISPGSLGNTTRGPQGKPNRARNPRRARGSGRSNPVSPQRAPYRERRSSPKALNSANGPR